MGKQKNGVTYVSQSKFDKDLNSSVDILIADGADDNTIKEYIQDYKSRFAVAEKKNSVSTGTSEETPSESPIQQPQRKLTSVGGAPIKIGVSASSVGKSKSPFGTPIQTFTEQKAQEFGEIKKKEAEKKKVATKPSVTSPFGLQPKTLETTLFPSLETSIPIAKPIPLSTVVADKQRQREIIKQEGLNEFLDKETKDFEDAVAGEGILNKVENFARSSWNTALAMATNLPFGIGEVAEKTIEKTGAVADKTSVEKYFKQAEREFNKENKTFTPDQLKQKAKEIKLKESKRNYIENQDAQFLEDIRNEEYLDPTTGEKIKIQDALRINDFEKYNTLNKESIKYSNLLKLNKEKVDGFYDDLKQAKNALNHQIIFGNFKYATDIYNNLVSKEDKKQDDLDFISYYEKNKDKAALSPVNPNLKNIVEKLENEINLKSSEFNSALDTQLDYIEKFDKSFKGTEDAYQDFDNSRRSYNNVFGGKMYLSLAETVNGSIKTIQTLAQLSDELKNKIGLPLPGADSLLFNKVFKDYNYYDFSKELEKRKELLREDTKIYTNTNSLLNYISDVTSTQIGQMILPMLTGYGGLAMPLLRQSAVYFASGFGRGVGESEEFEERVNRGLVEPGEIGKVHTFAEKLIHGGISGGADVLGNLPTALRLSKSFNSLLSNPTTSNMFWKSWTSKGLKGAKDLGTELSKEITEENLAELFQDLSRAFVLNEPGVNIGSSISDVTKDTTTFTLISKIFPLMGKGVINRIASSSDKNKLSELEKELFYWKNKLNEDISEETKSIYSDRISKIESEIDKTNKSIVEKVNKDKNAVSAIESLNVKIDNTLLEANKINENKDLSKEEKAVLLKPLENEYKKLVSNRNDIIDGKKKSFDILPEEEKTKFKTQAAEAIIQEELDKGVEKDKIQEPNPEVINKKAIEIYESTKQATGQVSEQEIKPATTEAETPITTQQVDAGLQTQKEVTLTPKTEEELIVREDEIIEIPEDELEALRQEVEEQKIEGSLSDNIGQKGYIGSKEGMIKIDDTNQNTIVFETNNEIIELGKVDEDSNKSIASFGISKFPQEGVRTEAKKGTSIPVVKVDGKEYEFVSRARDKKGKAVVKLKEKETGLIRRLSGEKAERILKDVALQSDKKEVKLGLKVSGKEVQTQEKTQKELKAEQKKRNSEERRKRREEFQAKTLEELKQEEKKSEELLAKIEEEILDELVKKSKNKDLVKVGQRIFQVTKKQDGTFSVSQVNTEGKLVGIRDEATRNKAIGVFKAKKTKADKKDLEEAQKLIDDFKKDERDRIEKLLDKAINTLDLQGKGAFDASIAIPAYAAKKFLEGIKVSYKAGKTLAEAINDGIKLVRNMGYTTISDFDLKEYALKQLSTKKETKDAIQKQITDEGVLQPKQSEMGLQEMEQGDQVDQEPTEQGKEKVSKVTPIKEVKDQLQDLFSAAKEAVRITKDKAKEINKLKNDLNQFVTANLVGLDASDIGKAAIKSINSAIQKTNDVNFEEQAEKINAIIDDLYLRKELKDEKVLEKKIEEMSKDTFYKDKTSSKVTKTKVTDAFKKKIEEAKKNFAKIKNPSIADKTAFVIEMNNLYKQGVSERKKIDEAERSRSKENANKLSIFALKKDGRVDKKKRISLESKSIEDAFKKGGVIYEGNIYLNTEKGRADFARDTNGLDRVIVNPISTPVTASGSEMLRSSKGGVFKSIKDLKRRYATATFSAERFFAPFYNVKGAKEFIENNWNNKLKVYSERIGRQISEFKDVRDEFLNDVLGKELVSKRKIWAKSKTASRIAAQISILKAIASKKANDPLSAFVKKNEIPFESKMLDETVVLDYELMVNRYDDEIKNAKNESDASKLIKQKEEFVNKYIAFERMTNEGVAALFNMIRQPEGFNKFLNSFSVEDALAIANYVNNNPKIREIADKSSKMFESIRDYVNPTLDKLGYDTLGESDYISKEDALSAMQGKNTKKTEGFYEMLDIIYPDGLPEKVPYFPLSAEGLSGTNESNVLEFFEDSENPNADYSLLFPSLFTRKAGGNLNLQGLSVESVFDKVSKEAVTLVNGVDIASDLRNLYANEGNNVAMLNAFGKAWNDQFKKKVLNIVKDDAYENAMNKDDAFGKILKNWVATRSMLRVSQLAINVFSAASQLFGIGVAYSKEGNLKYLKNTMQNLLSPSKRKAELDKLSNAFNAIKESKNYKERVNKRRDSADVAAIKSVKEKVGFALVGDVLSDMLFLTTIMDQLSVMFLAPIYSGKYANKEGISDAEKMDEFFAEEVNKTLQSNAPYYTGTVFYNKTALLLGAGGYLQSPRQGMELILNETEAMLRREGDSVKRTARIIGFLSFSSILPVILKDVFRGSDDEDEDEKSKADKKTEALQVANKIGDAILEATGVGGSAISAIKNAALIKTSPEIMEMDVNPSDIKTSDIVLQSLKSISPNSSITMRDIDNVLDNKEIYSTVDQVAYGIETGIGFPAAQLKKQTDYLTALGSEYYDFNDYWNLITGKVSQSEFKKFEKEIGNLTETLDKVIYPYTTKDGTLNTSFLNKKQINELSKMSFENKANYVEEIRLMLINKAVADQVVLYKKGGDGIDKSKGFYKVRESKLKNEISDMLYKLLRNKYNNEDNDVSVDDVRRKLKEFKEDNNISEETLNEILKSADEKANKMKEEEVELPALKKVKEYSKGRDRAKFIYSVIGDMQNEDKFKYINILGDEFDDKTKEEYFNILKIKQERGE